MFAESLSEKPDEVATYSEMLATLSWIEIIHAGEQLGTYQGEWEPGLLGGATVAEDGNEEDETSGENEATAELLEGQGLINFLDRLGKLRGQLEKR